MMQFMPEKFVAAPLPYLLSKAALHDLTAAELAKVEAIFAETLAPFREQFPDLIDHLQHYKGKRLRPMLVLLSGLACGKLTPAHYTLAAVVEMIHTATLVHDDVLDEAETRRHVSTINSRWGNQQSILLGDVLFSSAFRLCATVDAHACLKIGETTNRVCAGELLQVRSARNWELTEADYFKIILGKTGTLTECCTHLGAYYAGSSPEIVKQLALYGRNLGLAFQIADDLLDLEGDSEVVGKTLGTDLLQGKLTLPLIRFLNEAPSRERSALRALLSDPSGHQELLARLRKSHALESSKKTCQKLVDEAQESLEKLRPSQAKDALTTLAHWSGKRDR